MLEALRKAAGTWVAKLLLVLLVLSFAVWGISGQIATGFGGNSVITAGNTRVTPVEYRLAYERQLAAWSQQFGTRLTREQAQAFGIDQQILGQLVAGAVLDEQASKLGLGLSEDRLAQLTMEDPAFRGPDGRFNRQQFEYALRQIGMRPEDYLRNRTQVAVRQQIVEAVSDGLKVPDTFLRAVSLYRGEDRTAEYIALPKSLVEPVEDPAADKLSAWFEERKATYAAPEYRKVVYIKLQPEDIADEAAVSDEQVGAEYERNKARFTTPETRAIEQLVFPSTEAAQTALDAIKSGSTFDSIVASQGKTQADTLLGTLTRAQVPDQAVADAAFSLQVGEVSPIVQGTFGAILLRVTEITPEVVKGLAEVSAEIRRDLALAEANRVLLDVHDDYEDSRAAGDSLVDAAAKLQLKPVTVEAIDRNALRPDGTVVTDLPESQALIAAAFETDVGVENPSIPVGGNGYLFYEVESVTPARDRTLDEMREKVVADWKTAEAAARLSAKAAELEKRLKDGGALDDIAAELALEKQTKRGLKRESDDSEFGRSGVTAVFSVAEGGAGVFTMDEGGAQILFKVTEVFEPVAAGPEAISDDVRQGFATGMSNDLLDQLVAQLQTQFSVSVNQAAITQAMAF